MLNARRSYPFYATNRKLDLRLASLTPDQRARMLALVQQDRWERRRLLGRAVAVGAVCAAWMVLVGVLVAGVLR